MSAIYETGHPKNVANLFKYNQFLATLGATYNPSNPSQTLPALITTQATADAKQTLVKNLEETWKENTNLREIAFNLLATFSVQLFSTLKTTNAPQQTLDDFLFLVNKMRGSSNTTPKSTGNKTVGTTTTNDVGTGLGTGTIGTGTSAGTKSNSQQSFDQKIEHFSKMILILTGVPSYAPNEIPLQIASLNAQLTNLITLNSNATNSKTTLTAARIDRNTFFYAPLTGWLDTIKKTKEYIAGVYGKQSQQYKTAISFKFVRVIPKKKAN